MSAIQRPFARRAGALMRPALLAITLLATLAAGGITTGHAARAPKPAREGAAAAAPTAKAPVPAERRMVAYYFYTNIRCASCRAIESWSRDAIQEAFADQIRDGRVVWKAVNTDEKGNEHYLKDFKLYTKSLVLVDEVRGKPAEYRNLEKVWQLLQDRRKFVRYVQDETRSFLSEHS